MAEIIDLSNRRVSVTYTVTITHHWNDTLEAFVEGVSDDPRSTHSIGQALRRLGERFIQSAAERGYEEKGD